MVVGEGGGPLVVGRKDSGGGQGGHGEEGEGDLGHGDLLRQDDRLIGVYPGPGDIGCSSTPYNRPDQTRTNHPSGVTPR